VKANKPSWMNCEYENLVHQHDITKKRAITPGNPEDWKIYKNQRNKLNTIKYKLKAHLIKKNIQESENMYKKCRGILNTETGRKQKTNVINFIEQNGKSAANPESLKALGNWLKAIGMKINPTKTKMMTFASKKMTTVSLILRIDNLKVEIVDHIKYLRVWLDSELNFHHH